MAIEDVGAGETGHQRTKLWIVTARYSGDGGYWGERVGGVTREEAEECARALMAENGDSDPDSIEIIDCDEVDEAKERLTDAAPALLKMLRVWATFAKNNNWDDENFRDGEGGWITRTDAALAACDGIDVPKALDAATVAEAVAVLHSLHSTLEGEWADPAAYGMPIENLDHNHHDDMMALRRVIAKLPS